MQREIGIAQQLPAQEYQVGLFIFQDGGDLLQGGNHAYRGGEDACFADFFGEDYLIAR